MAKQIALAFLIGLVSPRNELSETYNTWTETNGDWYYNEVSNEIELKQSLSADKHAEIAILNRQWHNVNSPLSINYTYSIDFRDKTDGQTSGVILYNGKAGGYCEYYYFGMESLNGIYYVLIARGNVNADEEELVYQPLKFTYVNNDDYTLSIAVHNGNTFDIWIDNIHHISYTDDSGYTTLDSKYSGYISIWSFKRIRVTARYLEISGTPIGVAPLDPDECVSLSPTTDIDPSQPSKPPTSITTAPTNHEATGTTLPHNTNSPSSSPNEAVSPTQSPAMYRYPSVHLTEFPSDMATSFSVTSLSSLIPTLASGSVDTTASIHHETSASTISASDNSGFAGIISRNVLILCLIGAGLLLLCILFCIICAKCRHKNQSKEQHRGVDHKGVDIGSGASQSGKQNEERMLQMADNNAYKHAACVDDDSDSMEQTDQETLAAAESGLAMHHDHDSSDEEHMLPSGNVTLGGPRRGSTVDSQSDEGRSGSMAPPIPLVPEDSDSENVPPAPFPQNQNVQENNAKMSGTFMTTPRGANCKLTYDQ
eukprot:145876_1